jgi:nucleoside 2-deoxyribosyltransferase
MRTIQNDVKKRAYIAIKYHANHGNRERIEGISTALERQGFEVVCIARDLEQWGQVQFDPGSLMQRTFNEIEASGVVVVDLTEKGVGVGIEAGYAFARHIPVVTIAQAGSDISETLRGISQEILLYDRYDDLAYLFAEAEG